MYNYDENLEQNSFFINVKKKFKSVFEDACRNKYYILVPKKDALESFNQNDEITVKRHVLVADDTRNGSFYNLLGEELCSCGSQLTLFSCENVPCCQAQILFEESYIPQENNGRSCRLLCINRLLTIDHGNEECSEIESSPKGPNSNKKILLEGYDYYVKLLFSDDLQGITKSQMLKRFDSFATRIQSDYSQSWLVGQLKVRAESEFKSLLNFLLLRKKRKAKVLDDKEIFCLQLAAEIYFFQCLHDHFFPMLSSCVRDDEAQLNTNRRLAETLSPADLGISSHMLDTLPLAKRELAKLNDNHTPYGKLLCMRKCMEILTSGPSLNGSWMSLSSDDMLPALVFLVIKLNYINNWASNLSYVLDFHFSKFADDELSYCLASFEAAIQYLKNGSLKDILIEKSLATKTITKDFIGTPDASPSLTASYQQLVEHCKSGNVKSVEQLFSDQSPNAFAQTFNSSDEHGVHEDLNCCNEEIKCHPLCKCKSCAKKTADRLSSAFNINSKFVFGLTALHLACFLGKSAITKMLGKKLNAIVDARDDLDRTPLHLACMSGSQGCTLLLLDMGAKQTALDCRGFTPLHTAVYYGHIDCVKALLYYVDQKQESGEPNVNAVDRFGESALFFAVKFCFAEIVQVLLENGASQRIVNKRRQSPKDLCDNLYISRLLSNDDPAIEYVCFDSKRGSCDISSLHGRHNDSNGSNHDPQSDSDKVTKLLSAAADNDLPMVKFHLGTADDYDAKIDMCHPLCQCDRCTTATEAVESYLNPNCVGADGLAAIHIASKYGYVELAAYLVRCGANPNLPSGQSTNCRTPLHFAAEFGCVEVIEVLLCNAADINTGDLRSNTPLHYAASKGHMDCLNLLLNFGADVKRKNADGDTPLHIAAKCERLEAMKCLISRGANPLIPNEVRLSPVDFVKSEDEGKILSNTLTL